MAEDAFDRVRRTAPDAEKSEDVVNAKRVEIIPHLREPFFPPRKAVGGHARPVVSGKPQFWPVTAKSSGGAPA